MKLPRIALPGHKFRRMGPLPAWELPEREILPEQELAGIEVKPLKPEDSKLVFKVKRPERKG